MLDAEYSLVSGRFYRDGRRIGSANPEGYIGFSVRGEYIGAHRAAFLALGLEPPEQVDHIDGNPSNNAWHNLRPCTASQNQWNAKTRCDNRVGVKGLAFNPRGYWVGRIRVNGRRLEKWSTDRAAVEQWLAEQRQVHHGEFANNG